VPQFYDATLAKMPTSRFGEPDEVAKAMVFVATPACRYGIESNIVVDGGFTQRAQFKARVQMPWSDDQGYDGYGCRQRVRRREMRNGTQSHKIDDPTVTIE
jgi:hypothetical protein